MLKANELRIGNYVFDDEGVLSKINGFQPYGHSVRCDENEGCELLIDLYPQDGTVKKGYETDINLCKPIPLTEEWLLKFGFKRHHTDYYNEIMYLKDVPNNNEFIWGVYPFELGIGFVTNKSKKLKYVHSLQNLYFALTGEELTIKK